MNKCFRCPPSIKGEAHTFNWLTPPQLLLSPNHSVVDCGYQPKVLIFSGFWSCFNGSGREKHDSSRNRIEPPVIHWCPWTLLLGHSRHLIPQPIAIQIYTWFWFPKLGWKIISSRASSFPCWLTGQIHKIKIHTGNELYRIPSCGTTPVPHHPPSLYSSTADDECDWIWSKMYSAVRGPLRQRHRSFGQYLSLNCRRSLGGDRISASGHSSLFPRGLGKWREHTQNHRVLFQHRKSLVDCCLGWTLSDTYSLLIIPRRMGDNCTDHLLVIYRSGEADKRNHTTHDSLSPSVIGCGGRAAIARGGAQRQMLWHGWRLLLEFSFVNQLQLQAEYCLWKCQYIWNYIRIWNYICYSVLICQVPSFRDYHEQRTCCITSRGLCQQCKSSGLWRTM